MGLLDNQQQQEYYQGSNLGNYQFTSLEDIINYFMVAYIGDQKIIPKANRVDIAFHAQRAMQELSFDVFKSLKSQSITLKDTLQMMLPHDYVNYTKISWADGSGIKHPLYPTKHTSNPFQIRQDDNDDYLFDTLEELIRNSDFSATSMFGGGDWMALSTGNLSSAWSSTYTFGANNNKYGINKISDQVKKSSTGDSLIFEHLWLASQNTITSHAYCVFQEIDTSIVRSIKLTATGESADEVTSPGAYADYGVVRVGVSSTNPNTGMKDDGTIGWARPQGSQTGLINYSGQAINASYTNPIHAAHPSPNAKTESLDLGYLEWNDGTSSEKELDDIEVTDYDRVWICIQSYIPFKPAVQTLISVGTIGGFLPIVPINSAYNTFSTNSVDIVSVITAEVPKTLQHANLGGDSDVWNNYKSSTPSENNSDDYEDDTYWPHAGGRYGLEPSHAQVNGSFFIDQRLGKIHFSSNISGKNVILDYISDGLGTDAEMQVHKFAEEAIYKWITHAILSTSSYGQALVPRLTKEKFAAIRKAKLRLSNIKIEELTQILRGKSKHIK